MLPALVAVALWAIGSPLWGQYDKQVFLTRGKMALDQGMYRDAITQFNALVLLDSTQCEPWFLRGIAKFNLGDIRGAQADFAHCVRLNPVYTAGYHYKAISESQAGNHAAALADLEKAISLRPGALELYFSRGVTHLLARQFPASIDDFNRYLRRYPKNAYAWLNRGTSHLFLGDTAKALADYDKAVSLNRLNPETYVRRAGLLLGRKDYKGALFDLDHAVELDSSMTRAWFLRGLAHAESGLAGAALQDLDKVLELEPGNALTLYNRSLLHAQAGNHGQALMDIDRVIAINPDNVLARFNRAGFFVQMKRWDDALADYNKAIALYPDFAKAYMNRSYVETQLGMRRAAREDYLTAQRKVAQYEAAGASGADYADTTRKYGKLLAFDADFSQSGQFRDEALRHRDVDIDLRPMFRLRVSDRPESGNYALDRRYEDAALNRFLGRFPVSLALDTKNTAPEAKAQALPSTATSQRRPVGDETPEEAFLRGVRLTAAHAYNEALAAYTDALSRTEENAEALPDATAFKGYCLLNRGVLRSEMIDFIASLQSNLQTLSMDDKGTTRAKVSDRGIPEYDHSEALSDLTAAARALPGSPHAHYNLGNLHCHCAQFIEAIGCYDKALSLHPQMREAHYNRGLVLIYLKDKEKGCIDLSRAGELGLDEAYAAISKWCKTEPE